MVLLFAGKGLEHGRAISIAVGETMQLLKDQEKDEGGYREGATEVWR